MSNYTLRGTEFVVHSLAGDNGQISVNSTRLRGGAADSAFDGVMPANMPEEGGKGKPPRHPPGSGSSAAHGEPPPQDGDGSNTGNYEAPAECQLVLARSSFQIAVSFTLVAFYITEVTTLALRGSY